MPASLIHSGSMQGESYPHKPSESSSPLASSNSAPARNEDESNSNSGIQPVQNGSARSLDHITVAPPALSSSTICPLVRRSPHSRLSLWMQGLSLRLILLLFLPVINLIFSPIRLMLPLSTIQCGLRLRPPVHRVNSLHIRSS